MDDIEELKAQAFDLMRDRDRITQKLQQVVRKIEELEASPPLEVGSDNGARLRANR